jgi:hypothetical protein
MFPLRVAYQVYSIENLFGELGGQVVEDMGHKEKTKKWLDNTIDRLADCSGFEMMQGLKTDAIEGGVGGLNDRVQDA